MASKKSYNRFFIIFQEEDRGYGMGPDKPPTGYVKVEVKNDKCKITSYVQNLKPFKTDEYLYKVYLISHQDDSDKDCVVCPGVINIDDLGRGEALWESNAENILESKVPIDKFNAAVVVVDGMGDSVIAPLCGYMSKEKFEWKNKIKAITVRTETKNTQNVQDENQKVEMREAGNDTSENITKFDEYEEQISEIADKAESQIEDIRTQSEEEDVPLSDVSAETELSKEDEEEDDYTTEDVILQEDDQLEEIETFTGDDKPEEIEAFNITEQLEEHEAFSDNDESEVEERNHYKDEHCGGGHYKHHEHDGDYDESDGHHDKYGHIYNYGLVNPYNMCWGCMCSQKPYEYKFDQRYMMCKALENILQGYESMDKIPMIKGCKMWKVDMAKYKKDGHMVHAYPYYDLVFYPMLQNIRVNYYPYIKHHGHYLFGIKYGKNKSIKAIVFAIPGKKDASDQPYKGKTGFVKWIPAGREETGYWIMMYDPITGMVLLPED